MFDGNILRAFTTLGIIVSLFGVLLWIIKKYTGKTRKNSSGIEMEIISKITLQPKNQLFVVKAGSKTLLLGVSEKNISSLADLSESVPEKPNFDTVLKQTQQNKIPAKSNVDNITENDLSFRKFLMSTLSKSN